MKLILAAIFILISLCEYCFAAQLPYPNEVRSNKEMGPESYYYGNMYLDYSFKHDDIDFLESKNGKIILYRSGNIKKRPLIISLGGVPPGLVGHGYAIASVKIYYADSKTIEYKLDLIVKEIRRFMNQLDKYDIDSSRISIMGFREYAMIAALLATNPNYLSGTSVGFGPIKAAILLDPLCLDIAMQMSTAGPQRDGFIRKKCAGVDAVEELSPIMHAGAPNADAFLMMPSTNSTGSEQQLQSFGNALQSSNTAMRIVDFKLTSKRLFEALGQPSSDVTKSLADFLENAMPSGSAKPAKD